MIDVESQVDPALPVGREGGPPAAAGDAGEPRERRGRTGRRRWPTTRPSPRNAPGSSSPAACSACGTGPRWSSCISAPSTPLARLIGDDKASYPEIMADIEATLVDRYFCNFSLFQSLPDNWAIDQLFPIMPIHRLDELPTRRGTLQDVTCDSDGVIDRFAGGRQGQAVARAAPRRRGRALHPRHLPHRRLSGDPRRPAQPLRRHQRGARAAHRRRATRSPTWSTATPSPRC